MTNPKSENDTEIQVINDLISNAKNSFNKNETVKLLNEAKGIANKLVKKEDYFGYIKLVEVLSELSFLTEVPSERVKLRTECLKKGIEALDKYKEIQEIALVLTDKLTDFLLDKYVILPNSDKQRYFTKIKSHIDYLIDNVGIKDAAALLCRKSALLRYLSKFQSTKILQEKMLDSALRCAEKSVAIGNLLWETHLAVGLSHWQKLKFEKGDENFNRRLENTQKSLRDSYLVQKTIPNVLSLCNFYRSTYQPMPFTKYFYEFLLLNPYKRQYFKQADMFSETAIQIWYGDYPKEMVNEKLEEAEKYLEEAINAGFNDAKMFLNLAFIKAALGEINVGFEIINSLYLNSKHKPWTEIAEMILKMKSENEDNLIKNGFALGVAESSSWNRLGTFISAFIKDDKLAISLYREAIKLNPNNAIALTNLARSICNSNNTLDNLYEAERLISKAASFSSPRFRWWRNVREIIKQKIQDIVPDQITIKDTENYKYNYLSDLYKTFLLLKKSKKPHQRGIEIEKIIERLLQISFSNSTGSYYTNPPIGTGKQIDASFYFYNKDFYRVEIKWEKDPVDFNAVTQLKSRLDIPDAKGLLISMSSFAQSAIDEVVQHNIKERQHILLMDGEDLELILQGSPLFDEAIRIKQLYFYKKSDPFHKLKAVEQRLD